MNLKIIIFSVLVTLFSVSARSDRIRLKDVETLTLYSDRWTTARRSAPVKQLTCVGGSCNGALIETVQCYNRGFDGNDIQWECKADLPSNYKFGRLEVSCEGYEYPNDDYILSGSCGLEYTISDASKTSNSYFPSYSNSRSNEGYGSSIVVIVFVGAAIALYFYLRPKNKQDQNNTGGRSWFNPSAPPAPGFRPDYYGTSSAGNSNAPPPPGFRSDNYGTSGDSTKTSGTSSAGSSNGPGFFSGMAAGSFLGYMFGNRGNTGYGRRDHRDSSFWNNPSTSGYSSYGNSRFGGSGFGSASGTSRTSTSTGFASTKRR